MFLGPDAFMTEVASKIHKNFNGTYQVEANALRGEGEVLIPSIVVSLENAYYAAPLMQLYVDYTNRFDGDVNRLCEDLCKKIEEFCDYTNSLDEIEVEM